MKQLLILFLLMWSITSFATTKRDTVTLYNGQVLIGEISRAQSGVLTIDDVDVKSTSVKQYKIKKLLSPVIFKITSTQKKEYYGVIRAAAKDGMIDIIQNDGTTISIMIIDINLMIPLEKEFFKRLNGNVNIGFSYTKSNGIGQINMNSTVSYVSKLFENELSGTEIASIDTSKFSRDNENLQLLSLYDITSSWFGAGVVSYQRNLELSIARRYQEIAGGGNKLFIRKNWQLFAISGLAFNEEKSTSDEVQGLLLEIPIMLRFALYKFNHPNVQINSSQTAYIGLSEIGRIRYSGNTGVNFEIVRDFYTNFNLNTNFDSKPPGGGPNEFDFSVTFGVTYQF